MTMRSVEEIVSEAYLLIVIASVTGFAAGLAIGYIIWGWT